SLLPYSPLFRSCPSWNGTISGVSVVSVVSVVSLGSVSGPLGSIGIITAPIDNATTVAISNDLILCMGILSFKIEYYINNQFKNSIRSEEHTSELQSRFDLVCRLLLEKKKDFTTVTKNNNNTITKND